MTDAQPCSNRFVHRCLRRGRRKIYDYIWQCSMDETFALYSAVLAYTDTGYNDMRPPPTIFSGPNALPYSRRSFGYTDIFPSYADNIAFLEVKEANNLPLSRTISH